MEKSIETIWKNGFLKEDSLVAPKVNNLYNQKSIHIIDKFKRMFKINLISIVFFSLGFLIVTYFLDLLITGIMFFIILMALVFINKKLLENLYKLDKGASCYEYLNKFNSWMSHQINLNEKFARYMYPMIFLSIVLGFWFHDTEGVYLGQRLVEELSYLIPNAPIYYGVPIILFLPFLAIFFLLYYFGGTIYKWDLNIVYGRVLKKLKTLLEEIETINTIK